MAKKKLTIPLSNGDGWVVDAEIVGDLALHEARRDPDLLSITHVPTLLTLNGAVPIVICGDWKKRTKRKALLAWMAKAQEKMQKDWMMLRKLDPESVRKDPDYSATLRDRIRKHCLETE